MAKTALSELCAAYYEPVVVFLRREGRDEDAARELAHGFFARLLEGGRLESAEQARGRFRSYLLGALKLNVHKGLFFRPPTQLKSGRQMGSLGGTQCMSSLE